jgi:hypothetical protein
LDNPNKNAPLEVFKAILPTGGNPSPGNEWSSRATSAFGVIAVRFVHFLMAWTFVIVPGPLAAYAGSMVQTHSHNRAVKFLGQVLGSALWWWWLVAVPLVFILHI